MLENTFTKSTGMPTPDDIIGRSKNYYQTRKNIYGTIVKMTAQEYINLCRIGFRDTGETGSVETARDKAHVQNIADAMLNGEKFDMPVLDYRYGSFTQEGLHRAMAVRSINPREKIPIVVIREGEKLPWS